MKIITTLAALIYLVAGQGASCPNGVKVRREWSDVSWTQRAQLGNCFRDAYATGELWTMCRKHRDFVQQAHGNPYFLPFHRCFVNEMESILERHGCNFGLPYWDATLVADNWWESDFFYVFGNLGGEVSGSNRAECLREGWFAGLRDYRNVCLAHDARTRSMYSPLSVARWVNTAPDYDSFRQLIENLQHAVVHTSIHYTMAYLSISACDPAFYAHHAAVDYYWAGYQQADPSHYDEYPGDVTAPAQGFENTVIDQCIRNREFNCVRYESPSQNPQGAITLTKRGDCEDHQKKGQTPPPEAMPPTEPLTQPPAEPARLPPYNKECVDSTAVPSLPIEPQPYSAPQALLDSAEPIPLPDPVPQEVCDSFNLDCELVHKMQVSEGVFIKKCNRYKERHGKIPQDLQTFLKAHPVETVEKVMSRDVDIQEGEFVIDLDNETDSDEEYGTSHLRYCESDPSRCQDQESQTDPAPETSTSGPAAQPEETTEETVEQPTVNENQDPAEDGDSSDEADDLADEGGDESN